MPVSTYERKIGGVIQFPLVKFCHDQIGVQENLQPFLPFHEQNYAHSSSMMSPIVIQKAEHYLSPRWDVMFFGGSLES